MYSAATRSVEVDVRAWQDCPRTWTCHSCKKSWCTKMIQTKNFPKYGHALMFGSLCHQECECFQIEVAKGPCWNEMLKCSLYFPPSFWSPWSEEAMGWLNSVMLLSSIGDCASRMMAEWLLSCWCMISMLSFLPQDVKKCLMKCGVEDKVQVFLFCCLATILSSTFFHFLVQQNMKQFESFCHALGDTQIVKEDFVEAINNVLNSLQPSKSPEQCMAAWPKLICFWGIASCFWLQVAMCLTSMQTRFWDTSHIVFDRTSMEDS